MAHSKNNNILYSEQCKTSNVDDYLVFTLNIIHLDAAHVFEKI